LSPKVDGVSYDKVDGELFGAKGPQLSNIKQGKIGDCYFLSAVGALVAHDPSAIRDMIRDNRDGTYSVRFYDGNAKTEGKPVWIRVNGDLPVDADGKFVYAKAVDSDKDEKLELWVPILEKAYAVFVDRISTRQDVVGYDHIDSGGHSDNAMRALTGGSAERIIGFASVDELVAALEPANEGALVTVQTKKNPGDGWVGRHVYTVVGTYEQDGQVMVTLRNPWGKGEPDGADLGPRENDGLFSIPADELYGVAKRVHRGDPPATAAALKTLLDDLYAQVRFGA
jgi:hypothetical protein